MTAVPFSRDPNVFPVAKDGKFLGYADKAQIMREGLEIFSDNPPALEPVAAPIPEPSPEGKGAQPGAVRKGPTQPALK